MRCKGRYVATVVIDYDFEDDGKVFTFEELHEHITQNTTGAIRQNLKKLIYPKATVNVYQQYADLYRMGDDT
jgi:hypothetical protein